jgi:NAD+ kinase
MIEKIGLVSRLDESEALRLSAKIYRSLRRRRIEVIPEIEFARRVNLEGGEPLANLKADLIVTVGGNGTVLKTCMMIPRPETPILAVNMGRRGFLTEVAPEEAVSAVEACMKGKCIMEERSKLTVNYQGRDLVDGLNETVVTSTAPSKMLHLKVRFDRSEGIDFRSDGLIIATPTGSTAYSLSAGGPIVDNSVEAFTLAFICPLEKLNPIVVSMKKSIEVEIVDTRPKGVVLVDGRFQRELPPGSSITVRKSPRKAVFARLKAPSIRSLMRLK